MNLRPLAPLLIALALLVPAALGASPQLRQRRSLQATVCPSTCVLAKFKFVKAVSECSGCHPPDSKWRCPSRGNAFEPAFKATVGASGFGTWKTSQCVHEKYSPSIFAFSGPGDYEDDFVPACPDATFCACGALKAKMVALLKNRDSLSRREKNDMYWAAAAEGFQLYQGFDSVTGGSWEHFELTYTHADGRRQFCSGVNSFTYSPQYVDGALRHEPNGYKTGCHFYYWPQNCDEDFVETGTEDCGWNGWYIKKICAPRKNSRGSSLQQISALPGTHLVQAASLSPAWAPWSAKGSCSKKCGGGVQARTRQCLTGSGSFAGKHCTTALGGSGKEETACNSQACKTWTMPGYAWSPGCKSGYVWKSTSWSWGKRKYTCTEQA